MEAARLHERRGAAGIGDAIAALQKLRAEDEGDAEALSELSRLHEAAGNVQEMAAALAERARITEDPRARAALWSRVGELRLGMLNDLDGAAEAYREALDGAPDDPIALSALESIEERREDWSTLQEVLMRRFGATFGADQVAVLLKLARNAEQKLSDADQAIGFLRQIVDADATNTFAYLELERLLRANARWYDLVEIAGQARRHRGAGGAQAGRAGAARGDRGRLGQGARLARQRRRGAGEGAAGGARRTWGRCCRWRGCTRARSAGTRRARRWRRRPPTPRRRPRSPRFSSATRRS